MGLKKVKSHAYFTEDIERTDVNTPKSSQHSDRQYLNINRVTSKE